MFYSVLFPLYSWSYALSWFIKPDPTEIADFNLFTVVVLFCCSVKHFGAYVLKSALQIQIIIIIIIITIYQYYIILQFIGHPLYFTRWKSFRR